MRVSSCIVKLIEVGSVADVEWLTFSTTNGMVMITHKSDPHIVIFMTWFRGCKVVSLWTQGAQTRNSWVECSGNWTGAPLRWFKLYEAGDHDGFINMFSTFVSAKQMNSFVDFEIFDNEPAGSPLRIFQVYGW